MEKKLWFVFLIIVMLVPSALADCDLGFKTFDQNAWGTSAAKNNSGTYRNANFQSAFPTGLMIGKSDGFSATFTNAKAVQLFLPATGVASVFNQSIVNATKTSAGILGGEVAALALNIGFDDADPTFSNSSATLGDLVVVDGFCSGMTVRQVLALDNAALSGQQTVLTPAQLQNCTVLLNKNFLNASVNNGHLSCALPVNATGNQNSSDVNITVNSSVPSLNTTVNQTVPVDATPNNITINRTDNSTIANTSPSVSGGNVVLSIAPWYPKNTSYVFFCNPNNFTPTNYSWYFGDGEKLVQIRNDNVYHTYKTSGDYVLRCIGTSSSQSFSATMAVHVA